MKFICFIPVETEKTKLILATQYVQPRVYFKV